jgi:hypothetical protein
MFEWGDHAAECLAVPDAKPVAASAEDVRRETEAV